MENDELQEGSLTTKQYTKLFSAYLFNNQLCAAKLLWRRVPECMKLDPELQKVWLIGQALWNKDYTQAYNLIDRQWSDVLMRSEMATLKRRIQQEKLKFISMHYNNILLNEFQIYLGIDREQANEIVIHKGWISEDGYIIPINKNDSDLEVNDYQGILDRLVTLSSFISYIES